MEATVIMARCEHTKEPFGIRAQKDESKWIFTWAFKLSEKAAENEGYDLTTVSGAIAISSKYPGCPHCESQGFYQCGACKKMSCYDGKKEKVTCPHCGNSATLQTTESFDDLKGGAY